MQEQHQGWIWQSMFGQRGKELSRQLLRKNNEAFTIDGRDSGMVVSRPQSAAGLLPRSAYHHGQFLDHTNSMTAIMLTTR
jgi:hypothetical protein